jgi:hypothetical protein
MEDTEKGGIEIAVLAGRLWCRVSCGLEGGTKEETRRPERKASGCEPGTQLAAAVEPRSTNRTGTVVSFGSGNSGNRISRSSSLTPREAISS